MKLSEVALIADVKLDYDRTKAELKALANLYTSNSDQELSIKANGIHLRVARGRAPEMENCFYRKGLIKAAEEHVKELQTKLAMFGVTDFES